MHFVCTCNTHVTSDHFNTGYHLSLLNNGKHTWSSSSAADLSNGVGQGLKLLSLDEFKLIFKPEIGLFLYKI